MSELKLPKPCANKCCVRKCGKPAHADLWIEENGAWVSFCTPHARFALKPTYKEAESPSERMVLLERVLQKAEDCIIAAGSMGVAYPQGERVKQFMAAERAYRAALSAHDEAKEGKA